MRKTKALKFGRLSNDHIKTFVERVEKLAEERDAVNSDIRDVLAEAKGVGYDPRTIKWLVSERKIDAADRDERDALRDTYAHALGMAVSLVEVEGLSLREAGRRTGISKSSIHRALAVPEASQPASVDEPAGNSEGIGHNSKRACILPMSTTWQEITSARDAHEARVKADKEAERERRRAERERIAAENKRIDADDLQFPPFLTKAGQRAPLPSKEK